MKTFSINVSRLISPSPSMKGHRSSRMPLATYCWRGILSVHRISGTLPAMISVFSFVRPALASSAVLNSE